MCAPASGDCEGSYSITSSCLTSRLGRYTSGRKHASEGCFSAENSSRGVGKNKKIRPKVDENPECAHNSDIAIWRVVAFAELGR